MHKYYPASFGSTDPILDNLQNFASGILPGNTTDSITDSLNLTLEQDFQYDLVHMPTAYFALNNLYLISGGSNYTSSSSGYLPAPEHAEGSQAFCDVYLGLTYDSVSISGGLNNSIGDQYIISTASPYDTDFVSDAVIIVSSVDDTTGEVTSWYIQDTGTGLSNDDLVISSYLSDPEAVEADVSFVPDKFCVSRIELTDGGTGYAAWDEDTNFINQRVSVTEGSGCVAYTDVLTSVRLAPNMEAFARLLSGKENKVLSSRNRDAESDLEDDFSSISLIDEKYYSFVTKLYDKTHDPIGTLSLGSDDKLSVQEIPQTTQSEFSTVRNTLIGIVTGIAAVSVGSTAIYAAYQAAEKTRRQQQGAILLSQAKQAQGAVGALDAILGAKEAAAAASFINNGGFNPVINISPITGIQAPITIQTQPGVTIPPVQSPNTMAAAANLSNIDRNTLKFEQKLEKILIKGIARVIEGRGTELDVMNSVGGLIDKLGNSSQGAALRETLKNMVSNGRLIDSDDGSSLVRTSRVGVIMKKTIDVFKETGPDAPAGSVSIYTAGQVSQSTTAARSLFKGIQDRITTKYKEIPKPAAPASPGLASKGGSLGGFLANLNLGPSVKATANGLGTAGQIAGKFITPALLVAALTNSSSASEALSNTIGVLRDTLPFPGPYTPTGTRYAKSEELFDSVNRLTKQVYKGTLSESEFSDAVKDLNKNTVWEDEMGKSHIGILDEETIDSTISSLLTTYAPSDAEQLKQRKTSEALGQLFGPILDEVQTYLKDLNKNNTKGCGSSENNFGVQYQPNNPLSRMMSGGVSEGSQLNAVYNDDTNCYEILNSQYFDMIP